MQERGVTLQYAFAPEGQRGAALHNPLFDLLSALAEQGSIQHAARALGCSYRHAWGQFRHWEAVLGEPLLTWSQGQPSRLTPFAERLLWAERQARVRLTPHIEALRAELQRVLAEALDGQQLLLNLWASHDPALPLLREQAADGHQLHLELAWRGSLDALRALAEGRCGVAGFHVPRLGDGAHLFARQLKPLLKPGRHKLIAAWRRQQGLIVARGNPLGLHDLSGALAPAVRFVSRQPGSGTRLLLQHLMERQGVDPRAIDRLDQCTEDSHLAVAAAVASGHADVGLGVAGAVVDYPLDFVPLVEEDYYLVCLREALERPELLALRDLLSSADWQARLSRAPGHAPAPGSGQVLSLTRALPWWRFRASRGPRP